MHLCFERGFGERVQDSRREWEERLLHLVLATMHDVNDVNDMNDMNDVNDVNDVNDAIQSTNSYVQRQRACN